MNISENSRIWIYQSDRVLNSVEQQQIQQILDTFTAGWLAHGHQLAAQAEIFHQRFIILSVDEQVAGATGCSIDKSVKLLQDIENQFHINLFDRFLIAYRNGSSIQSCNRQEFEKLIENGSVTSETIVFNNMLTKRFEIKDKWEVALKDSWHAKVFQVSVAQNT
ncbi:hypothetical protein [Daejeonella oryzae]|uniref:hypothetical protein n=1 Tax=Daejeonella oryzae TaxID=1122943 RepID=UPI000414DC29|nr:hypothetical protein [Daejeonella oryzae]